MSSFGPYHATSSRILLCLDGDSGDLSGSAISTFTFNETAAFPYFCTITVVEAVDEMQVEEDTSATGSGDPAYGMFAN